MSFPSVIVAALLLASAVPVLLTWTALRTLRLSHEWRIAIICFAAGALANAALVPVEYFIARLLGPTTGLGSAAVRATLQWAIPEQVAVTIVFLLLWRKYGRHLNLTAPATGAFAVAILVGLGRSAGENLLYLIQSFTLEQIAKQVILPPVWLMIMAAALGVAAQRAITEETHFATAIVGGTLVGVISHAVYDTISLEVLLLDRAGAATWLSLIELSYGKIIVAVLIVVLPYKHGFYAIWQDRRGRITC